MTASATCRPWNDVETVALAWLAARNVIGTSWANAPRLERSSARTLASVRVSSSVRSTLLVAPRGCGSPRGRNRNQDGLRCLRAGGVVVEREPGVLLAVGQKLRPGVEQQT